MKKSYLLITMLSLLVFNLFGQSSDIQKKWEKRNAVQFLDLDNKEVKRSSFMEQYHQELGLSTSKDLQERKTIKGINGWTRIRMTQRHEGIRVVGAAYILHEKEGIIRKGSGDILPYISIATLPSINQSAAESAAVNYTNSKILSKTEGEARVLPEWDVTPAELVIMDKAYPEFSGDYLLAYHVIVAHLDGLDQYKEAIYIDASNSSVVEAIPKIAHSSEEGIAKTFYYGEQSIISEKVNDDMFILHDSTRGNGIITLNGSLIDFEDEDNYWDNVGNKEEVSGDAHYCASSFYDFMLDRFSWDGIDGEGFELKSRVFGSENNRVNATWNGRYATFYSGDCAEYGPLTTLDVVGHEFAHGFTEFTSGLIYRNESGALNESISDILGKGLEFTYDEENSDWLIGSRFLLPGNEDGHFRNMQDPNSKSHPKLYVGEYWSSFGAVHTNSGVFNFWFYLLSEGQTDVNELGVAYNVAKIGFEKATQIVFTMNTAYLTESSTYTKAVVASVESVKDLFGENSPEMASVLEAWKAVGLSPESGNYDLKVELVEDRAIVCADDLLGYDLEVYVINTGVNPYLIGDEIELRYDFENELLSIERVSLEENFMPGDTLFYTFDQSPPLVDPDTNYDVLVTVEAFPAPNPLMPNLELLLGNNTAEGRISTNNNLGLDVQVNSITLTSRRACEIDEESQITIRLQNIGCTQILEGEYPITITAAGSEYNYDIRIPFDVRPGAFGTISDLIVVPEEIKNGEELIVELLVPNDILADNNTAELQYLYLATVTEGYHETFSSFDVIRDTDLFVDPDFRADAQVGEINGEAMLILSGTGDSPFSLDNCGEANAFFRENFQKTDIEMCVNTEGMLEPTLSFDLVMHRADALLEDIDQDFAVMVKVSIDEDYEIGYPIILNQEEGVSIRHEFELPNDFTDQILIQVMTLRGNGAFVENENFEDGDFALLDNLRLTSGSVATTAIETRSEVQVSPNPGNAQFYFNTFSDQQYELSIYDGLGRLQTNIKDAVDISVWDSRQVDEGIYFYDLVFKNGERKTGKIIVSRK